MGSYFTPILPFQKKVLSGLEMQIFKAWKIKHKKIIFII